MTSSLNKSKQKKRIVSVCFVLCIIFVFWVLYSTPAVNIDSKEKEVESIQINYLSEEFLVTEAEEIEKILNSVNNTRTKIRILFYDEEMVDESESGFLLTVNFKDNSSELLSYSESYNGFQIRKDSAFLISFRNQKLFDLIKTYFNE